MKKILNIVGLGIQIERDLTLGTLSILKSSEKILLFPSMGKEMTDFLHKHGISQSENILDLYRNGDNDHENYKRVYEYIGSELNKVNSLALAVQGHPRLGVTLVKWLENLTDLDVNILPAVSSFDTMINNLAIDPLEKGSVLVDANRLLLFNYQIDPRLDHYIYHVCSIGTSKVHVNNPAIDNRIDLLRDHLLKYYAEDCLATLICSPTRSNQPLKITKVKIKDLNAILDDVHFGTTLFIPGVRSKTINEEYLSLLREPS